MSPRPADALPALVFVAKNGSRNFVLRVIPGWGLVANNLRPTDDLGIVCTGHLAGENNAHLDGASRLQATRGKEQNSGTAYVYRRPLMPLRLAAMPVTNGRVNREPWSANHMIP